MPPATYIKIERVEGSTAAPDDELVIKRSSWDDDDLGLKYTWRDSRGHRARGGEIPVSVVPEAIRFVIQHGFISESAIERAVAEGLSVEAADACLTISSRTTRVSDSRPAQADRAASIVAQ